MAKLSPSSAASGHLLPAGEGNQAPPRDRPDGPHRRPDRSSIVRLLFQLLDIFEGLVEFADDGPGLAAPAVELAKEHDVLELLGLLEPGAGAGAEGPVAVGQG